MERRDHVFPADANETRTPDEDDSPGDEHWKADSLIEVNPLWTTWRVRAAREYAPDGMKPLPGFVPEDGDDDDEQDVGGAVVSAR